MFSEMERIVETGLYPSRNAIVTAGIKKVIEEVKAKKQAQTATSKGEELEN